MDVADDNPQFPHPTQFYLSADMREADRMLDQLNSAITQEKQNIYGCLSNLGRKPNQVAWSNQEEKEKFHDCIQQKRSKSDIDPSAYNNAYQKIMTAHAQWKLENDAYEASHPDAGNTCPEGWRTVRVPGWGMSFQHNLSEPDIHLVDPVPQRRHYTVSPNAHRIEDTQECYVHFPIKNEDIILDPNDTVIVEAIHQVICYYYEEDELS